MSAKAIRIEVIDSGSANSFIRRHHYSGKVVPNSKIHFGVFLKERLGGVISFGAPMHKRKMLPLVQKTKWDGMLELNRVAFTDLLPKNSESRALAISFKKIRRMCPNVEWILSFADATQCGDGTIYRASGFILTGININKSLARLPSGEVIASNTITAHLHVPRKELGGKTPAEISGGGSSWKIYLQHTGGEVLTGYQLRYIYFINKAARKRLTVKEIPFSRIREIGASMYKGKRAASIDIDASAHQQKEGGESPTAALHF